MVKMVNYNKLVTGAYIINQQTYNWGAPLIVEKKSLLLRPQNADIFTSGT